MLTCTSKVIVNRFVFATICTTLFTNAQGPLSNTCSKVKEIQYLLLTYPPHTEAGGCQPELMEFGIATDSKSTKYAWKAKEKIVTVSCKLKKKEIVCKNHFYCNELHYGNLDMEKNFSILTV